MSVVREWSIWMFFGFSEVVWSGWMLICIIDAKDNSQKLQALIRDIDYGLCRCKEISFTHVLHQLFWVKALRGSEK